MDKRKLNGAVKEFSVDLLQQICKSNVTVATVYPLKNLEANT